MIRAFPNLASQNGFHGTGKRVLETLGRCFDSLERGESVLPGLKTIQQTLQTGLELDTRPEIYCRLNYLMGAFLSSQERDQELYSIVFEIITEIKRQIEQNPQGNFSLQEKEWGELEKSVYLLSDWEDFVFSSSKSWKILNFNS